MSSGTERVRWRYRSEFAGSQQLDRLLDDGWEPFAATPTHGAGSTRIHLRKARPSDEPSAPSQGVDGCHTPEVR